MVRSSQGHKAGTGRYLLEDLGKCLPAHVASIAPHNMPPEVFEAVSRGIDELPEGGGVY